MMFKTTFLPLILGLLGLLGLLVMGLTLTNPVMASGCCNCYGKTNVKAGGWCDDPIANIQSQGTYGKGSCACERAPRNHEEVRIYRQPRAPIPSRGDKDLSCAQLQQAINNLEPLTYSYKPGAYDDPLTGIAALGGTLINPVLWVAGGVEFGGWMVENKRIQPTENRIEVLRRLKAERHCFER